MTSPDRKLNTHLVRTGSGGNLDTFVIAMKSFALWLDLLRNFLIEQMYRLTSGHCFSINWQTLCNVCAKQQHVERSERTEHSV